MHGIGWITFLFVGLIAGWIAEKVMKKNHGLLTNLIVGVVGAYLGAFLFAQFSISVGPGFIGALVVATVGAVVLLAIINLVRRA